MDLETVMWLENQEYEINKNPREVILDLLERSTDIMNQLLIKPDSKNVITLAENYVLYNTLLLEILESNTTPHIVSLKENEVFVFGSNEAGIHGKGAAKTAIKWGAKYGTGYGLQGNTYAIPTKDKNIQTLSVDRIKPYVDIFIEFVKEHPELTFLVTEIGCGLAGFKPKDIAPLFNEVKELENVHLPIKFWGELKFNLE